MDAFGFTEADTPFRSKHTLLRDVAFQLFFEGPASPVTDMYIEAALRGGATSDEIQHLRDRLKT